MSAPKLTEAQCERVRRGLQSIATLAVGAQDEADLDAIAETLDDIALDLAGLEAIVDMAQKGKGP